MEDPDHTPVISVGGDSHHDRNVEDSVSATERLTELTAESLSREMDLEPEMEA